MVFMMLVIDIARRSAKSLDRARKWVLLTGSTPIAHGGKAATNKPHFASTNSGAEHRKCADHSEERWHNKLQGGRSCHRQPRRRRKESVAG